MLVWCQSVHAIWRTWRLKFLSFIHTGFVSAFDESLLDLLLDLAGALLTELKEVLRDTEERLESLMIVEIQ